MELAKNVRITSSRKFKMHSKSELEFAFAPDKSSKLSVESSSSRLSKVQLDRYCPKKLFYIVFVNESGNDSSHLIDSFAEVSRNYEVVSSVTFITRNDVLDLLNITNGYTFPNQLKPLLLNIIDSAKQCGYVIPPLYEAQLLKLKIIQVMYEQYAEKVKQNQKEKNLEDLLNFLSRECKKKQKKDDAGPSEKNKSPVREETKKKNKKDDNSKQDYYKDDIDYTSIPLDNDGISFEENLFDYVWFYCITGYYEYEVIQNLTEQLNCPPCAIIKVVDSKTSTSYIQYQIDSFWKNVNKQFFANTTSLSCLEDTMLMQYIPSKIFTDENILELFQQFVFVLRRIVDIKLTHLKYLRHLAINKIENIYPVVPLDCLQTYHRSLKYFPVDSVNSMLIIDALVKEVCSHLDFIPLKETSSSRSVLSKCSVKSIHSLHCMDPLHDFEAFSNAKKKPSFSNNKQNISNFLVHNDDVLLKVLKFYKHVGPKIVDISLNFMKRLPVFKNILQNTDYPTQDIPHTHDVDPSHKSEPKNEETLNNFMCLFLFNTFLNKVNEPDSKETYNLTKNLLTFDPVRFWEELQPKSDEECISDKVNLYNTAIIHFRWKEKLSSEVMIQKIFTANQNFLYCEQKYSPETDNFFMVFSDKLDSFGLNTKIFEEAVRTPICLRDFCRYTTVQEAEWLKKYQTKIIDEESFKVDLTEVCPGAYKVKTQMKLFQEYSYLLDGNIKEVDDNRASSDPSSQETAESQKLDTNFEQSFIDLQKCPTHKELISECEQASEAEQLTSYDLGSNAFRITGHVTTFCSNDGVKVTVDNTRLLQKPEKCTINIQSDGNTLTLHSCEALISEPYVPSLLLQDDTRISFLIQKHDPQAIKSRAVDLEDIHEESEEEIKNVVYDPPKEQMTSQDEAEEVNISQVVHCIDEAFFKDLFQTDQSLDSLSVSEDRDKMLEAILRARENNGVIYKVDTESKYLKKLNRDITVPVEHALRNVFPKDSLIYNNSPKSYETYTKRFTSLNEESPYGEVITSVDFRLCLPNGLFIRAHPCVIDQRNIMIKQEYADDKPKLEPVQHEEFRLFSYHGFILIKKIDGTLTILKGNGDIIDFEKPSDQFGENNSFKPCHCSTLDDYRNKLNKMLKDENNSEYFTSRRGHIAHKQNHIMDKKLLQLLENFDVPYLKKSITRFDGKRIKIQGNKITQKHLHHMTSQQDFFTEEIYFERSDDFKSTFERNGSQKILFPDGTLISNSVNIADELVDDFVYVTISFQYEHPNYATVTYDFDKTLKIMLDGEVVVKRVVGKEGLIVNTKKNTSISVTKERVSFQKTCGDCSGVLQCDLNIEPFYSNKWTPSEEFLHVQDTYEKHFYSDYTGNCSRKSKHITGSTNSLNCNHYKKNNDYKKLFIVNKDLTGEIFSTNDKVQLEIKEIASDPNSYVNCYKMFSTKTGRQFDCRKRHYIPYCNRFFNNTVYKYFYHNVPNSELYTTFRIYHNFYQSVKDIEEHVLNLREIYFSDFNDSVGSNNLICKNIASLITSLQVYHKACEMEMHAEKENIERKKKDQEEEETRKRNALCHCIRERISMADKINNWKKICAEFKKKIRLRQIPCYFNSDFCKRLD